MKFVVTAILAIFTEVTCLGQMAISINVRDGDSLKIRYLRPFQGFANEDIETTLGSKVSGKTILTFDNARPIFIRLIINNKIVELAVEPKDTIRLSVSDPIANPNHWLTIAGPNAAGHTYYNLVYNRVRIDKFFKVQDVFERHYARGADTLIAKVKKEIDRQMRWLDSLKTSNRISAPYYDLMQVQISTLLAWEVGEQCKKFLESKDPLSWESGEVKRMLFALYDPMDPRLRYCLSKGFYSTYFEHLFKTQGKCTSEVIVDDTPFYCLAPADLQGYLWGASLMAHYKYDPDQDKNCRTFERYAARFGSAPFVEYLRQSNICHKEEKHPVKILEPFDADLFTLIAFSFPGRRVFIDLWATWCAPCKADFKHYDASFYAYMNERKIALVYISIDKLQDKKRWENDVNRFNLTGFHILAGQKLKASIKEIVFDGTNAAIPRYVLVREDGKIVSVDFIRPSDPTFRDELDKALR